MKTTNKLKSALLDNDTTTKAYQVKIDLGNGRWAELNFSEKVWAQAEYNRIKVSSIYCDNWVKTITLDEIEQ
jgi:hypothetical protein